MMYNNRENYSDNTYVYFLFIQRKITWRTGGLEQRREKKKIKRKETHPVPRLGRRSKTVRYSASSDRCFSRLPPRAVAAADLCGTCALVAAEALRCPAAGTRPAGPRRAPRTTTAPSATTNTATTTVRGHSDWSPHYGGPRCPCDDVTARRYGGGGTAAGSAAADDVAGGPVCGGARGERGFNSRRRRTVRRGRGRDASPAQGFESWIFTVYRRECPPPVRSLHPAGGRADLTQHTKLNWYVKRPSVRGRCVWETVAKTNAGGGGGGERASSLGQLN